MTAYGVPAVAGVENLGLFAASYDAAQSPHHHHYLASRGSSLRRLLALPSSDSDRSLQLESPTARDRIVTPDDSGATTEGLASVVTHDAGAVVVTTRYMFSFDDSCYALAVQLYVDLSAAGFSVFAPPPPPVSGSLESAQASASAHEEATRWAAAEKNGKVILLVTPESVGRPSGACLNDISAAMAAGLGFVPLMVRQCEIPLSICRIQWLDMSDCLLYAQSGVASSSISARLIDAVSINSIRYGVRVEQLMTALRGNLDHEGQQARLFSILSPLSFQQQISKLTSRFAGRTWLFDDLEQWIAAPTASQVYWVAGPIGSGKTALAARMVQLIPEIAAFHFALQEDEQTQNARRCVLSLAYQLTTQLPQYASLLQSREPLEQVVPVSNFNTLVTRLLVEPLNDIARPRSSRPLVVLIDGLEHLATGQSAHESTLPMRPSFGRASGPNFGPDGGSDVTECLVSALPSLVSRLPNWVRIVVLSRKDPGIIAKLQGYTPSIVLDEFPAENEQDIRTYISNILGGPSDRTEGLSDATESVPRNRSPSLGNAPSLDNAVPTSAAGVNGTDIDVSRALTSDQVRLIVKQSEGLFLYAVNIIQSIKEKRLAADQLESLPIGMGGYFRQFFDSHFDEHRYKVRRPLCKLYTACVYSLQILIRMRLQDSIRPVLEILCASFEPFPLSLIASILSWSVYEQQEIAASFGSLLFVGADGNIRPFHSSVLDWVQDLVTAGMFFVDVANGHERIGKWAAREYDAVVRANRNDFVNLEYALGEERVALRIVVLMTQRADLERVCRAFVQLWTRGVWRSTAAAQVAEPSAGNQDARIHCAPHVQPLVGAFTLASLLDLVCVRVCEPGLTTLAVLLPHHHSKYEETSA